MNTTLYKIIAAVCLAFFIFGDATSQVSSNIQVGFGANFGQELFRIKNEDFVNNYSAYESKASGLAVGGGIWLEKFVASKFSIVLRTDYHFIQVKDHVIVGNIAAIPGLIKESSHSLVLGVNARYYIPLGNGFRLFADAGVKADKMLYFRFQQRHLGSSQSLPNYYGFINPGVTSGIGLSKKRWGLSVNYENYLAQSKSKLINSDTNLLLEKRSVSRQNVLFKLTYCIWHAKYK